MALTKARCSAVDAETVTAAIAAMATVARGWLFIVMMITR
jgi:hypothetical protein